jgi:hypothetical protein
MALLNGQKNDKIIRHLFKIHHLTFNISSLIPYLWRGLVSIIHSSFPQREAFGINS